MEKKYLVVVYYNLRYLNSYNEFTNKQKAEDWYKHMLNKAEKQKNEDKDRHHYIIDVGLYALTEIG